MEDDKMESRYFACDWIIDIRNFNKVWRLIDKVALLNCEIKDSFYEFGLETKEGLKIRRFIVRYRLK